MDTENKMGKERITLSDRRLYSTIPNNIKNIHAHLQDGNEILVIWPTTNKLSVLTKPEHISECGDMYLAAEKHGKGKKVQAFPCHIFFVGFECSLLGGTPKKDKQKTHKATAY